VVDGSNLATEGRTLPSLAQLDEAVRAYAEEDPGSRITVVVDASFEHRIDESERELVREAMLNGEVVSPPAGAIGRGDAFVLRIAERTGAVVLSNDSFQEFHGEHPWLFDEGRLIGGKPVPGVGWIFTPRLPIRGPKSRAATAEKRPKRDPESAPAKAAELSKAAKKAAKRSTKKAAPAVALATTWPIAPSEPPPARRGRKRVAAVDPDLSSAIDEAVAEALDPAKPKKAAKADKTAKTTKKKAAAAKTVEAPKKQTATKKAADEKKAPATRKSAGKAVAAAKKSAERPEAELAAAPRSQKKRSSAPLPAVNEPLSFITFVAAFPVGSTVEGEVVSFTSHGAMVDVALPDGGYLHCYIPLSAMGTPAPTKAREVLTKGVVRPFVLAGLDPPRRVAELALPAPGAKPAPAAPATAAVAAKRAPAPAAKKPRGPAKKAAKTAKVAKTTKVAKTAKAAKAAKSAPRR
jgi:hypothetical protein